MADQPAVDPRQRQAAALCLAAFRLPIPVDEMVKLTKLACRVWPGGKPTVQDVMLGERRAALLKARELIDEMLAEPDAKS